MDWVGICNKIMDYLKKYRYVLMVLLAGLFLMALPDGKKAVEESAIPAAEDIQTVQPELQDSLAEILSQMEGAGKVQVLLTQAAGEQTLYQTDVDQSTSDTTSDLHRETVIITDSARAENGLIQQVNPPIYKGAIVLCQGADRAAIRLSIVEAVANATGLTSDKITVLKMK